MSLWQMAVAAIRASTSPGPGGAKVTSSMTRGAPKARQTAALTGPTSRHEADGPLEHGQAAQELVTLDVAALEVPGPRAGEPRAPVQDATVVDHVEVARLHLDPELVALRLAHATERAVRRVVRLHLLRRQEERLGRVVREAHRAHRPVRADVEHRRIVRELRGV